MAGMETTPIVCRRHAGACRCDLCHWETTWRGRLNLGFFARLLHWTQEAGYWLEEQIEAIAKVVDRATGRPTRHRPITYDPCTPSTLKGLTLTLQPCDAGEMTPEEVDAFRDRIQFPPDTTPIDIPDATDLEGDDLVDATHYVRRQLDDQFGELDPMTPCWADAAFVAGGLYHLGPPPAPDAGMFLEGVEFPTGSVDWVTGEATGHRNLEGPPIELGTPPPAPPVNDFGDFLEEFTEPPTYGVHTGHLEGDGPNVMDELLAKLIRPTCDDLACSRDHVLGHGGRRYHPTKAAGDA